METRYDLLPAVGIEEVSKILTKKLEKHDIHEWRANLKWSEIISDLEKSLIAFRQGKDFDEDGLLHIANVASDALLLSECYTVAPHKDDRVLRTASPRIALDLDNTVLNFDKAYRAKFGELAPYWDGDYDMPENLKELQQNKEFWTEMEVLHRPTFEVAAYVTARSIPVEWTQECIAKNNLPTAPIHSLPFGASKVETLKALNIDILIDDSYRNYTEATKAGIYTYLMDSYSNRYYDVGHRRLYNLDLVI